MALGEIVTKILRTLGGYYMTDATHKAPVKIRPEYLKHGLIETFKKNTERECASLIGINKLKAWAVSAIRQQNGNRNIWRKPGVYHR